MRFFNIEREFGGHFPAYQDHVQLHKLHWLTKEAVETVNIESPVRTETFPSDYSSQTGRTSFSPGFCSSKKDPLDFSPDFNFSRHQQPPAPGGPHYNWVNAELNSNQNLHNSDLIQFASQDVGNVESCLFSGRANSAPFEPVFSDNPLSILQPFPCGAPSGAPYTGNQLGLSDITKRLEGLFNVPLSPQSKLRGPGPTLPSWPPMVSSYSKASTLTPSSRPSQMQGTLFPHQALHKSQSTVQMLSSTDENSFVSSDDEKIQHMFSATPQKKPLRPGLQLGNCISQQQQQSVPSSSQPASWSQVVRTSSVTPARPSPPPRPQLESRLVVEEVPHSPATVDYHRGPKVDPRWPVAQQVFLGPIPKSVSWDEIRNVFYTKVQKKELLHFYVQSKPVNEVVYGQVVFDRASLASRILKNGPVKVRGVLINVTSMKEKLKSEKN